jgi:hypothetical protein
MTCRRNRRPEMPDTKKMTLEELKEKLRALHLLRIKSELRWKLLEMKEQEREKNRPTD